MRISFFLCFFLNTKINHDILAITKIIFLLLLLSQHKPNSEYYFLKYIFVQICCLIWNEL